MAQKKIQHKKAVTVNVQIKLSRTEKKTTILNSQELARPHQTNYV